MALTLERGICFGKILNKLLVQQDFHTDKVYDSTSRNIENNELVVYTILTHFIKSSCDHLAWK
jgi:hypothetical protein